MNIQQLDHSGYTDAVGRLFAGGDYPDVMIMSADMFKQYAPTGLLWDMSEAYANAKFQSHLILPEINENLKVICMASLLPMVMDVLLTLSRHG